MNTPPTPSLLSALTEGERALIELSMVDRSYASGECVMREGEPGDGCFLIVEGMLRVEVKTGAQDHPSVLGHLGPGRMVGEMSLVGDPVRSATVIAQTPAHTRWLSASAYAALAKSHPAVALAFTRVLAQDIADKMRQTNARLTSYLPPEASPAEAQDLVARALAANTALASPYLGQAPTDRELMDRFLSAGIDTACLVADSIFAPMDQYLMDLARDGRARRWVVPSERSIPAVAAGRWLATGQLTLMMMQNSGFPNAMDYLRTVLMVHQIPGLVLASWRGFDPILDESEPHILLGDVTDADTRNTVGDAHVFGRRDGIGLADDIDAAIEDAQRGHLACLRVSPPGFTRSIPLRPPAENEPLSFDAARYANVVQAKGCPMSSVAAAPPCSRDEALMRIHLEMQAQDPFYIVGNGYNPRAMQALRLTDQTFENAGGMGSSLAMAWGAAKSDPGRVFVAIEGDQNAVMGEMEKLLVFDYPDNLYWYILDNGIGESVGPSTSLPLAPWYYDLARVIRTRAEAPGAFRYSRINDSGLKFTSPHAKALAGSKGNLPAQAHLARALLERHRASRK